MTIRDFLAFSPLELKNHIFIEKGIINDHFEQKYLGIRKKEGRIYSDEEVSKLPSITINHALAHEWRIREQSTKKLIQYLTHKQSLSKILEIGCGNGWLSNQISKSNFEVCGLDVNQFELEQGARVFIANQNVHFVLGNIFTVPFPHSFFDIIILPSSIQYFSNIPELFARLFEILSPNGEIHILDSPIYHIHEREAAKQRSKSYYTQLGFPEMGEHYFHHCWDDFRSFPLTILHNPQSLTSKLKHTLFKSVSPFHWIRISNPQ